jgi:hypothetical protein
MRHIEKFDAADRMVRNIPQFHESFFTFTAAERAPHRFRSYIKAAYFPPALWELSAAHRLRLLWSRRSLSAFLF